MVPSDPISDFRSDTVTKPSARMRAAMAAAEVGDDVLDGDPTVRRLEDAAAAWLGKERALFVPSGTMANQVAVGVFTRPGDEVLLEASAHMLAYESGALGALHGVQTNTLVGQRGALPLDTLATRFRPDYVHCPRTALLCLEQTHMASGGSLVPFEAFAGAARCARERGVPVHLDGARLANAVVASGVPAARWAAEVDSVSLCLSKGLGAPVGSIVAGTAEFARRALPIRKRLGGWMRQSGILAAAGLMALEENVERLAEDHALARSLAEQLDGLHGLACPVRDVHTNIVLVRVRHPRLAAADVSARLAEHGVRVMALDREHLRFVTHLDVGPRDVERTRRALELVLGT
jgi:threonine aldolase